MAQVAQIGFDGQFAYVEEDLPDLTSLQPPQPKIPQTIASAKLNISDGVVSGFAVDSAIAGGFAIDTGKFWMFFGNEQPDIDYIVNVFDGGLYRCYVQPQDYSTDSFVVTTTDLAGNPADPACISIIIMRAI